MTTLASKRTIGIDLPTADEEDTLLAKYSGGEHDPALQIAQTWLEKYPEYYLGWKVAGYIYQSRSQSEQALLHLTRAASLGSPDAADFNNLAVLFTELGRLQEAQSNLEKAIAIQPKYGKAWTNLAMVHQIRQDYPSAQAAAQQAVSFDETDAAALIQLGNAFEAQGLLSQAQASYYRADMAHEPRRAVAHSNVLYLLTHDVFAEPQHLFAEHLAFGSEFETPLRANWSAHKNTKDPSRPLNVGFVSGDLHHHALANFLLPVFDQLGSSADFELHAYYTHSLEDSVTQRMRPCFSHWHAVAQLNDIELCDQIQKDKIDILFDLSGHTKNNRLLAFARKPAPIQISWLGYLGSTGLKAMDYYLCDSYWIPPGSLDWQFTEKTLYLPAAVTFQPDPLSPPVNALPALSKHCFTFGSFNRVSKINESVLVLWSMLMHSVPNSKLLLGAIEPESRETLRHILEQEGISSDRIVFFSRMHTVEYLTLHHQVDLCLDTFPHGGGATTAHAAWMGVPTLCMAGETPASRFSATLMHHLKLDSFVATSIKDYVAIGVHWSQHTAELRELRAGLRAQFIASPLGQAKSFSDQLGATLRSVWKEWCEQRSHCNASNGTQPIDISSPLDSQSENGMSSTPPSDAALECTGSANRSGPPPDITDLASAIPALIHLATYNKAAGQLLAAKVLYLQVLKMAPKHDLANHSLGVIESELSGPAQALPWLEVAIQENPQCEQYWISYINALMQSGAVETAISAIEWGQKYGLKSETAQAMASDFVATLERMREAPPPPPDALLDEFPDASPAPDWPSPRLSQSADLSYITAPKSSGRRYVIFAPLYRHNSAGIRVMFELQKWLILAGYDAIVIAGAKEYALAQFADDIIVYPEVVTGNPLKARRVVRYILNVPGKLSGTKTYAKHELLVAYSAALAEYAGGNVLQTPSIESIFYSDGRVKTVNAVYVGKGKDLKLHPDDCVYITGSFPATRFEVAEFMRSVKTLYTYDSFSVIAHEAMECGCDVKLIDKDGSIGAFPDPCHTPIQEFKEQLHDFIQISQSL
jgi:predicted O-linked N-acetylglucosamine transferase (SPINDLY family)